jgi:transcription elongation GreA/GreB family factor
VLIGIPRESKAGETLVATTAKTAAQLRKLGYDVIVESGAGAAADVSDDAYREAEARVGTSEEVWAADAVVKVNAPTAEEIARLRPGATIVSQMAPGRSPELLEGFQAQGVTALAMDAVPRISRAQSMDVLSSQANVAGYRAVVEAAHEFGRMFTGQVTAAGKVPPDVVTMNSRVRFCDLDTGEKRELTVVFPNDADIGQNKVSILTPIGTALLGNRVDDTVEYRVPGGLKRFRIEEVLYQPEAAGNYYL